MENSQIKPLQPCFVVVMANSRYEIGLAHAGIKGYTPGYGVFDDRTSYEEASMHVDELNEYKFGLTKKEAMKITMSTMF